MLGCSSTDNRHLEPVQWPPTPKFLTEQMHCEPLGCCMVDSVDYGEIVRSGKTAQEDKHYCTKHTNNEMRWKFFKLTIGAIVLLFYKTVGRVVLLATGDFVMGGYSIAKKKHELKVQQWSLNVQKNIATSNAPPGKRQFALSCAWHISAEFVLNIVKIVTLPFAMIAKFFVCLYGIIDPVHGSFAQSDIEEMWTRNGLMNEVDGSGFSYDSIDQLCDYDSPCMQPRNVVDLKNLHGFRLNREVVKCSDSYLNAQVENIKDQFSALRCLLVQQKDYLTNEGLNVYDLEQTITDCYHQYYSVVKRDKWNNVDKTLNDLRDRYEKQFGAEYQRNTESEVKKQVDAKINGPEVTAQQRTQIEAECKATYLKAAPKAVEKSVQQALKQHEEYEKFCTFTAKNQEVADRLFAIVETILSVKVQRNDLIVSQVKDKNSEETLRRYGQIDQTKENLKSFITTLGERFNHDELDSTLEEEE